MNFLDRSAKHPKFLFLFDWRLSFMFFLLVLHFRMWVLFCLIGTAVVFAILNHFGYSINVFYNKIRTVLAGNIRVCRPFWWQSRFIR